MFENAHLVERFLNYWRSTGHQRIGFLYGRYEIHADVPLGIRATVAAIYEPPQVNYFIIMSFTHDILIIEQALGYKSLNTMSTHIIQQLHVT